MTIKDMKSFKEWDPYTLYHGNHIEHNIDSEQKLVIRNKLKKYFYEHSDLIRKLGYEL